LRKTWWWVSLGIFFVLGVLFFLVQQEFIIVRTARSFKAIVKQGAASNVFKKNIELYVFDEKADKVLVEPRLVPWHEDAQENLKRVISEWLEVNYQERVFPKKNTVLFSMINKEGSQAHISFHDSLLMPHWSIYTKWNVVESLLKTLDAQHFDFSEVVFLVQGKPMKDEHLDFLCSWPVKGYRV
jgi:hypothetical protein